MTTLQNSAVAQRFAAWRRRGDVRYIKDVRELAEARFAIDRARCQARSTTIGPH